MAELQRTPFAWLVDAAKVHNALKRKLNAAGIKNVGDYLVDPAQAQPPAPQPPPDPAVQLKAAELHGRQQEAALKLQILREEAAAKLQLEREKAAAEVALARERMAAEIALARERVHTQAAAEAMRTPAGDDEVRLDEARPGGALDQ
jgi:hypothetical protein